MHHGGPAGWNDLMGAYGTLDHLSGTAFILVAADVAVRCQMEWSALQDPTGTPGQG